MFSSRRLFPCNCHERLAVVRPARALSESDLRIRPDVRAARAWPQPRSSAHGVATRRPRPPVSPRKGHAREPRRTMAKLFGLSNPVSVARPPSPPYFVLQDVAVMDRSGAGRHLDGHLAQISYPVAPVQD